MAQTVLDYEERQRRIELVGEYRVMTGASTREIAKYFSENDFKISNYTVDCYIKEYAIKHPDKKQIIEEQIEDNKSNSIKKAEVLLRVYETAKLIQDGFTIEEIAKAKKEHYWVIYRDIHERLKNLDVELFNTVSQILKTRSMNNLDKDKKL